VYQLVQGAEPLLFKVLTQVHVGSDTEITAILLFNCAHVRILPLLPKRSVFIAAADSPHARCIFCHTEPFVLVSVVTVPRTIRAGFTPFYHLSLARRAIPPLGLNFILELMETAYNCRNCGDMDAFDSERIEPDELPEAEWVPLSGEKLAAATQAMSSSNFLMRLTARIVKLAKNKGFHSPFKDSLDLPGGKSAGDLACDILEKALSGRYTWDQEKIPNFYHFCLSRTESILSNWLTRAKRSQTMCHVLTEDAESGALDANPLNTAAAPDDIYMVLRIKEGGALGDRFLEDFALSLTDGSPEQRIVLAVFDDRQCAGRSYCCKKLNLPEDIYDAAVKRLLRRLPAFLHEWRGKNHVGDADWKEAR
jgi:DNA-directed RNA polymerase specialized sigma24 family protein